MGISTELSPLTAMNRLPNLTLCALHLNEVQTTFVQDWCHQRGAQCLTHKELHHLHPEDPSLGPLLVISKNLPQASPNLLTLASQTHSLTWLTLFAAAPTAEVTPPQLPICKWDFLYPANLIQLNLKLECLAEQLEQEALHQQLFPETEMDFLLAESMRQSPNPIMLTDEWGKITFVNAAYCDLLGYDPDELLGNNPSMLRMGDIKVSYFRQMWAEISQGRVWQGEFHNRRSDGEEVWLQAQVAPVRDLLGNIRAYQAVTFDMTQQVQQQQEAQARQQQFAEIDQIKQEFLNVMSHELRTPMNAILGMTDILLDTPLNDSQKEDLQMVQSAALKLKSLATEVLDLAMLEAGCLQISDVDFNLRDEVHQSCNLLTPRMKEKGLQFHWKVDAKVPELVKGSPTRLRQILHHLLDNAWKFTPQGQVSLQVELMNYDFDEVCLCFSITDTGKGIAPDQLEHLFDKFTLGDASDTRTEGGIGIGLAVANQLTRLLDGKLWVTSEPGQGSSFFFTVRFHPSYLIPEALEQRQWPEHSDITGARILVVEDNLLNQKLVQKILTQAQAPHAFAGNGAEALILLSQQEFDLVLMDVQMPVMDGLAATRAIRRGQVGRKDIPILGLTANHLKADKGFYLSAGMNEVLAKPVNKKELLHRIQHWHSQNNLATTPS